MRRCPLCNKLLWQRKFDGWVLDGFRGCGETWFASHKFDQFLQSPKLLLAIENAFRKGEQPSVKPQATNLCPTCRKPLTSFRHPKAPSVVLDSCPYCRGVCVDENELAEIHKALQPTPQTTLSPLPAEDQTVTKDLPIVRGYHHCPSIGQRFVTTAYHTCLHLWAVEYERAVAPEKVTVPAPLAASLA